MFIVFLMNKLKKVFVSFKRHIIYILSNIHCIPHDLHENIKINVDFMKTCRNRHVFVN